jgi:hypothetical protein
MSVPEVRSLPSLQPRRDSSKLWPSLSTPMLKRSSLISKEGLKQAGLQPATPAFRADQCWAPTLKHEAPKRREPSNNLGKLNGECIVDNGTFAWYKAPNLGSDKSLFLLQFFGSGDNPFLGTTQCQTLDSTELRANHSAGRYTRPGRNVRGPSYGAHHSSTRLLQSHLSNVKAG